MLIPLVIGINETMLFYGTLALHLIVDIDTYGGNRRFHTSLYSPVWKIGLLPCCVVLRTLAASI